MYNTVDLSFSPDGKTIVIANSSKGIQLLDVETGKVKHSFSGHTDGVRAVAFSHDGKTIASGGWDGIVYLWPSYQ